MESKAKGRGKGAGCYSALCIKRPISINEETWEKYQGEVTTNVLLLEKQGWAVDGIKAYARYINKNIAGKIPPGDVLVEIDKCNKQTQLVGSEVFKKTLIQTQEKKKYLLHLNYLI